MNTEITYEYRDWANYRFHATIVVAGELTADMWARMRASCSKDTDCGFIAHQVGLPEVFGYRPGSHIYSADHVRTGYDYDEENDHCWHRFADGDENWCLTTRDPTDKRTALQLVEAFEAASNAGWKSFDPAERFGLG